MSWFLSFLIVWIGLGLFEYYLESKSSIGAFTLGIIGFFVAVNPAMDVWEKLFQKLFKIDKK